MKHQITVLLGCAMFLGACNKENVVETPIWPPNTAQWDNDVTALRL
ncbi:MAG: hypothetical protein KGQ39_03405 [Bacteroidetes bacterium]|jgi:hypothetical protein|nr:hypothetical protein [Bacteroidota bacterium]